MNDKSTSDSSLNTDFSNKNNLFFNRNNSKEDSYSNLSGCFESQQTIKLFLKKCDDFDKYISSYIYNLEVNERVEKIIYIFARIFNSDIMVVFYILLLLYQSIFNQNYFFIVKPLIHVFIVYVLTGILKYSFQRPRPEINENVIRRYNIRKNENNFSNPSGDSMQAANFAIIAYYYFNGNYIGFILLPFVMFSRIFFFCHYVFDTLVGAFVGLSVSFLATFPLKSLNI